MLFSRYTTLPLAVLSATITASPLPEISTQESQANSTPTTGLSFTVQQVARDNYTPPSGAEALLSMYSKYGWSPSSNYTPVLERRAAVSATPSPYNSEYYCPVSIDGQTLNLDFDTGSADLWVFSTSLPAAQQSGHTLFNPATSANFKALAGYTWDISYVDGSGASGTVGTDTVNIGGATVTSQAVEIATSVSTSFQQNPYSNGLVGLASSNINTVSPVQQNTFFSNLLPQLALGVFTANLKNASPGQYDFGIIDSTQYTGAITYSPVPANSGYWMTTAAGYSIGRGAEVVESLNPIILDTGSSLLLLQTDVVQAYYAKVSGGVFSNTYSGYVFPCSTVPPTFTFFINGYRATMAASSLVYEQVDSVNCYGSIQESGSTTENILGDVFFENVFVVFDGVGSAGSGPRLGFATKSGN